MDESRTSDPCYARYFLGREDAEGLKYHLEYPDGNFHHPWLDQKPERDMIDLRAVSLQEKVLNNVGSFSQEIANILRNHPELQVEIDKLKRVEQQSTEEFIAKDLQMSAKELAKRAQWQKEDEAAARTAPKFLDCGDYIKDNPFPHMEDWWREVTLDIRKEWSRLAGLVPPELKDSGMPLPVQAMVEGKINQVELEISEYQKLAGLSYVHSKAKLEKVASELHNLLSLMGERIDKLVEDFKKLQPAE